jgi:DNA-directed RNA polymerase sigma subunit (sigma70/sigma32)
MKKEPKPQPAAYDGMTQQEVADSLGITRTAVQQIEQRAYKKFKRLLAKRMKHVTDLLGD